MPEPRSPIPRERRLEAAREWYEIFSRAAAAYRRVGAFAMAEYDDKRANDQKRKIQQLEAEWAAPAADADLSEEGEHGTGMLSG